MDLNWIHLKSPAPRLKSCLTANRGDSRMDAGFHCSSPWRVGEGGEEVCEYNFAAE